MAIMSTFILLRKQVQYITMSKCIEICPVIFKLQITFLSRSTKTAPEINGDMSPNSNPLGFIVTHITTKFHHVSSSSIIVQCK